VLPPLEAGAYAALIPFELVWSHEAAAAPVGHPRFRELASLAELPAWIDSLA
jgi:putative hydrolase of the HAD superfamily